MVAGSDRGWGPPHLSLNHLGGGSHQDGQHTLQDKENSCCMWSSLRLALSSVVDAVERGHVSHRRALGAWPNKEYWLDTQPGGWGGYVLGTAVELTSHAYLSLSGSGWL